MDLTETIAPKSDQLNAEDLLAGPRTFTIENVTAGTPEQPVNVHLVELPGRPYRPSKSMRRVMVNAWGKEAATYAGRRITLYRDPEVTFGRDKVGGIKISHLSHIDKPVAVALTVTRGKRAPHTVQPITDAAPPMAGGDLYAALGSIGITTADAALPYISQVVGRVVGSTKELTREEASAVIEAAHADADARTETAGGEA